MNSNNFNQNHDDYYMRDKFFCVIPQYESVISNNNHVSDELFWIIPLNDQSVNSNDVLSYLCSLEQLQQQQFEPLYIINKQLFSEVDWYKQLCSDVDWLQQQSPPLPASYTDYSRFLSFLKFDDSFLTLWNWKPYALQNCDSHDDSKSYMNFQSGSFFAYQVDDLDRKQWPNSSETDSEEQRNSSETDGKDWRNSSENDNEERSNSTESDSEEWSNFIKSNGKKWSNSSETDREECINSCETESEEWSNFIESNGKKWSNSSEADSEDEN